MKTCKTLLAVAVTALLLSGCEDELNDIKEKYINSEPEITIAATSGYEKQEIVVAADVEDEGAVSLQWSQSAGVNVQLQNSNTDTVSFIAPNVTSDIQVVLTLTATDEQGLSSSESVNVEIKQQLITLQLQGIATDSPLADAAVKASIGESVFTANTDSDGHYTLDLALDDDTDLTQLVTLQAQGTGEQKQALLQSQLKSFSSLVALTEGDNSLNSEDDFSLNVTNFSTAKAALMARENLYQPITSEQTLSLLESEVNSQELINVATAIKVILDKSAEDDSLGLPEGVDNVLELALDNEKMTDYIESVAQSDEFAQAQQEMLDDENVVAKAEPAAINTLYYNRGNLSINQVVELNEDGSGNYIHNGVFGEFTWSLTDNAYTIYNENGYFLIEKSETIDVNGVATEVSKKFVDYQAVIELVTETENGYLVKTIEYTKVIYPNGEKETEYYTNEYFSQVFSNHSQQDFVLGDEQITLSVPAADLFLNDRYLGSATLNLNPDGSGTLVELDNKALQWQLVEDNDKQSLQVTFGDYSVLVRQLSANDTVNHYAAFSMSNGTRLANVDIGSEITSTEQFTTQTVPGIYSYNFDGTSINEFWFELWPNGKAHTIETSDNNRDGQLEDEEVSIYYGNWSVDDGLLTITRNFGGECYFIEQSSSCWLWNNRQWRLLEQANNVIYVSHLHEFYYNQYDEKPSEIYYDNRKFNRTNLRPVSVDLPDAVLQKIGYSAPVSLSGLIDPSEFYGQTLFAASHDNGVDASVHTLLLNESGQYSHTLWGDETSGAFQTFADSQVLLKSTQAGADTLYGFLLQGSDVVLGAYQGLVWPHFTTQASAQAYLDTVASSKGVSDVAHLFDKKIYMIDRNRNGQWSMAYLMFNEQSITLYSDDTFAEPAKTLDYSIDEQGLISFTDDENTMYLSLVTDTFNIIVTNDVQNNSKDFNYLLFDKAQAMQFVTNGNALKSAAQR